MEITQTQIPNKPVMNVECRHKIEDHVVTEDHEICCKNCGAILDTDNVLEVRTESIVNLFQEVQPGCKPVKLESSIRIHEAKFVSSSFSNACDKLNIPRYVALDAYKHFMKIVKAVKSQQAQQSHNIKKNLEFKDKLFNESGQIQHVKNKFRRIPNYEIATYSLFISIRKFGILKSANEIGNAIKFAFSVKHVPDILKIFTNIKPIANSIGINCDDEDHLEYWINIYLRSSQKNVSFLTTDIKNDVRRIAKTIHGTDEMRARLSVKLALAGLGIKNV